MVEQFVLCDGDEKKKWKILFYNTERKGKVKCEGEVEIL